MQLYINSTILEASDFDISSSSVPFTALDVYNISSTIISPFFSATKASPRLSENPTQYCVNFLTNGTHLNHQSKHLCTLMESAFDALMAFILNHLDQHICGNVKSRNHYTKILYCSILVNHLNCMEDEGTEFDIDSIPRFPAVSETIEEMCASNESINMQCLFGHFSDVSQCIEIEVKTIFQMKHTQWTYGALDKCSHLVIKVLCMWEELLSCGEKTSRIMTNVIVLLYSPQVCLHSGAFFVQSLYIFIALPSLCHFLLNYFSIYF